MDIHIQEADNGYIIDWHTKSFEERTVEVISPKSPLLLLKRMAEIVRDMPRVDVDVWNEAGDVVSKLDEIEEE